MGFIQPEEHLWSEHLQSRGVHIWYGFSLRNAIKMLDGAQSFNAYNKKKEGRMEKNDKRQRVEMTNNQKWFESKIMSYFNSNFFSMRLHGIYTHDCSMIP
jgi:hypothetical protein